MRNVLGGYRGTEEQVAENIRKADRLVAEMSLLKVVQLYVFVGVNCFLLLMSG